MGGYTYISYQWLVKAESDFIVRLVQIGLKKIRNTKIRRQGTETLLIQEEDVQILKCLAFEDTFFQFLFKLSRQSVSVHEM